MKKMMSKKHADHLKHLYMKTGLDRQMIMVMHHRKAALGDILAACAQLFQPYEMRRGGASRTFRKASAWHFQGQRRDGRGRLPRKSG